MPDTPSLRAVLDVMDRADTLDAPSPTAVDLQRMLVQAALDAGATQSATTLQRAAAEHLGQPDLVPIAPAPVTAPLPVAPPAPHPFSFGWARPRHAADQQAFRARPLSRLTQWLVRTFGEHDPASEIAPATTGDLSALSLIGLVAPPFLGMVVGFLAHSFLLPSLIIGSGWWLSVAISCRISELSQQMTPPPDPVFIRACLMCDEARHYLKACLDSELPLVLQGDRNQMEAALQRQIMRGYHHTPPRDLSAQDQADLLVMFTDVKEHTPD